MEKMIKIHVIARTNYLPEESSVAAQRFLWSYEITIENQSDQIIQLLNRHWRITDMTGKVEEIRGPGVVGLQPLIKPNKSFVYTSFCQLGTPQGTMEGQYEMQTLDDIHFFAAIPKFVLSSPSSNLEAFRSRLH